MIETWLTPEILGRAQKLQSRGRRTLMREFGLTDHRARILADILADRLKESPYPENKVPAPAETRVALDKARDGIYKIGIVADTHLGSVEQQLTHLHDTYKVFEREGVREVFHAGDVLAGINVYRGQHNDLFLHSYDDQVSYTHEHYPQIRGIRTRIIGGNHDLKAVLDGGLDPIRTLVANRPDLEYLGAYSAWVTVGPLLLYLLHPLGKFSYAISYKLQKLVESFEGGRKPNLLAVGHWHQSAYVRVRGVHAFLPGCFEAQTEFERRLGLQPQLGALMLTIRVKDDGEAHELDWKTLAYFVPREEDY